MCETDSYDLNALKHWDFTGTALAVVGHPIEHSISPHMHNAALRQLGDEHSKFQTWRYFKFDIKTPELKEALRLFHAKGFLGLNLTVPHKVTAVPLVKTTTAEAHRIGAVNTLLRQEDGYIGYNSDGYGLERALDKEFDVTLRTATIILLGAGGAARAAAVQCLQAGCRNLWIGNRSTERLKTLLHALKGLAPLRCIRPFPLTHLPTELPRTGIVINATSLGLRPNDPAPIDLKAFEPSLKVYDMIYKPAQTALLRAARRRGMSSANGLSMLVHQGARALSIWTQTKAPIDVMHRAALSSRAIN